MPIPGRLRDLPLEADTVVVNFLNADSDKHARFMVRRLKRARQALRVGVVFWSEASAAGKDELAARAEDINADFVALGMSDAVIGALADAKAVPLRTVRRLVRRPPRRAPPRILEEARSGAAG